MQKTTHWAVSPLFGADPAISIGARSGIDFMRQRRKKLERPQGIERTVIEYWCAKFQAAGHPQIFLVATPWKTRTAAA
jgi:hypothetical protein